MSAKATQVSAEQLKRRQAFMRLRRSIQHPSPLSPAPPPSPAPAAVVDAPEPLKPQAPPTSPAPQRTITPPPHHGVAFSVREPMTCEICQQKVTKWLSYRPEAKTCVCWNCGMERQKRIMQGERG
jgi:hypothetical protein